MKILRDYLDLKTFFIAFLFLGSNISQAYAEDLEGGRPESDDSEAPMVEVDLGFGDIRIAVGGVDIIRPSDFSEENQGALSRAIRERVKTLEYQASVVHSAKHPIRSAVEVMTGFGPAAELDKEEFKSLAERIPSFKSVLETLLTQGPLQLLSEGIKLSSIVLSPKRLLSQDSIAPLRMTFNELSFLSTLGFGSYFADLVPTLEFAGKTWAILGAGYLVSFTNGDGRTGMMQLLNLPAAARAMLVRPLTVLTEGIFKGAVASRWLPFSWLSSLNSVVLNAIRPRRDAVDDVLLSLIESGAANRTTNIHVRDKESLRKELGFVTRIELGKQRLTGQDAYVELLFRNHEGNAEGISLVKVTAHHEDPLAAVAAVVDQVPTQMRASIVRVLEKVALVQHQLVGPKGLDEKSQQELWPSFVSSVRRESASHLTFEFKSGAVVMNGRRVSKKVFTQGVDNLAQACQTMF
jgi:hypothetical protein